MPGLLRSFLVCFVRFVLRTLYTVIESLLLEGRSQLVIPYNKVPDPQQERNTPCREVKISQPVIQNFVALLCRLSFLPFPDYEIFLMQ